MRRITCPGSSTTRTSGPERNAMPRIEMTKTVRVALLVLRVYLLVMLGLILVKFMRIFGSP